MMRTLPRLLFLMLGCFFAGNSFAQSIAISATQDTVCSGTIVTFSAVASGVGTPHYQWLKNSVNVGTDSSGFTTASISNSDVIMCLLSSSSGGATIALSAPIVMSAFVTPTVSAITGTTSVCRHDSVALTEDATGGVWSSSGPSATVSSYGMVTGQFPGVVTISYVLSNYCGSASNSIDITVTTVPAVGAIAGTANLCVGGVAVSFTDTTASGAWSSSNTSVASIDGSGNVTGIAVGTATITYSVTNSCGTTNRTRNVNVNTTPGPSPITGTLTVCQSDTVHLHDMAPGGVWSSSDAAIALVTGTGGGPGGGGGAAAILAGIGGGTAMVTYAVTTPCGSYTNTATVNIDPLPVVYPIQGMDSVCPGGTLALTEAASGGAWQSAASGTASVSATGVVTGVAAGVVNISYSLTNTCGTTTQSMAVAVYCPQDAGVKELGNAAGLTVYPNPAHDVIFIDGGTPALVRVMNMYGQVVSESRNAAGVSIAALPDGIYVVALYDRYGVMTISSRIVKN